MPDNAGFTHTCFDAQSHITQFISNHLSRPVFLKTEFRILMKITSP